MRFGFGDRDPRMEADEMMPYLVQDADQAIVKQAIDTVARRLIAEWAADDANFDKADFPLISNTDFARVKDRTWELAKEIDRGNGPFEAAYELLKRRAERDDR